MVNYDTEYIDKYTNVSDLDRSGCMRNNTMSGYTHGSRDLEQPSRTKAEAQRPRTDRHLNDKSLWEMHPTNEFVINNYPGRPAEPNNFDMRAHMPQYRTRQGVVRDTRTPSRTWGPRNIGAQKDVTKSFWLDNTSGQFGLPGETRGTGTLKD